MRDNFSLHKYVTYVSVELCGTDLKNSFKIVNSLNLKMVLKLHCPQKKKLHKQKKKLIKQSLPTMCRTLKEVCTYVL